MLSNMVKKIRSEDIMSDVDRTVEPTDTLSEALGKMKKYGVWELPVVKKGRFQGYLTFRTLARRRKLPISAQVKNFMISPPRIRHGERIPTTAKKLITRDFQSLPVVYNKFLKGIVSRKDIIKAIKDDYYLNNTSVEAIMNFAPQSLTEDTGIGQAMHLLELNGERTAPVLDSNGNFAGCVSVSDIAGMIQKPRERPHKGDRGGEKIQRDRIVSSFTRMPETLDRKATIREAVDEMLKLNTSQAFITDGKQLAGIVSEVDILEILLRGTESRGPLIQIAGVDDAKLMDASQLHDLISKLTAKIEKYTKVNSVTVRIKHHHYQSDDTKYTVNVKMTTRHDFIAREEYDYNLDTAITNAFDVIEKKVRKNHERRVDRNYRPQ